MGNPVAFEARADDLDTRGFISITTIRPVPGCTANWMLQPPVSTPTARAVAIATSRICWYSRSVRVIAGATVTESPVCTPIGSMFSIEQTTTTLSWRSRISSSSNSFQPMIDSSRSTSVTGLASRPAPAILLVGDTGAGDAERERRPALERVAELGRRPLALVHAVADAAVRHFGTEAGDDLLEPLPVRARRDRLDVGADQLDPVPGQRARLMQADSGVQRGLATQRGKHRVRAFGGDHLFQHVLGDRLHVGGIGELGISHDRRRVGVDQADPDALLAEHPAGLGAGVVELACLPDHDRPGPDDQD